MNGAKFNVSAMNYSELDNLAKTIEEKGEKIYDSLMTIKNSFIEMRDAGFAGSTLTAVLQTLDKIGGLPEDVRYTCEQFKKYADQAIEEVNASEGQVLRTLQEIINSDPLKYEFPEWYTVTGNGTTLSSDDIV